MGAKLAIVVGRRKRGKSAFLINEMNQVKEGNGKSYLLVPEQSTLESESDVLKELEVIKKSKVQGLMNIQVISFKKLGNLLLKTTQARTKILLKEQGQKMILRKVLKEIDKDLVFYRGAIYKEGLLEKLLKIVLELREVEFSLESTKGLQENKVVFNKLKELYLIKRNYEEYLEGKYFDELSFYDLLKESVLASSIVANSYFYLDDFFLFSQKQLAVVKSLIKAAKGVMIALPLDLKERNNFALPLAVYQDLQNFCLQEKIDCNIVDLNEKAEEPMEYTALNFLEENYFKKRITYSGSSSELSLTGYGSMELEVKQTFQQIISLVKVEKLRYENIKIVCNSLDSYRNLISLYSEIYQIPIFIDALIKVHSHPLIQTILNFLKLEHSFDTASILYLLKGGYLHVPRKQVEKLETYVREYGIEKYRWGYPFKDAENEEVRVFLLEKIQLLRDLLKDKKTVKGQIEGLYQFLEKMEFYDLINQKIETYKEESRYEEVYIATRIWNILLNTFDQCVVFLGGNEAEKGGLTSLLSASLLTETIKILPTGTNQVIVLGSEEMFKEHTEVLFVLGAKEGAFPNGIGKDHLFPLKERDFLEKHLVLRSGRDKLEKKIELETYFTLTAAKKYLFMSYACNGAEGEKLFPSHLFKRLERMIPSSKMEIVLGEDFTGAFYSEKKAFLDLMIALRNGKGSLERKYKAYFDYFRATEPFKQLLAQKYSYADLKKQELVGYLNEKLISDLLFKEKITCFSTSKLECYGKCPYAYFLNYGLKLKEDKNHVIESLDIGNIYHDVLEAYSEAFVEKKGDLDAEETLALGKEIFLEYYEKEEYLEIFNEPKNKYRLEKIMSVGLDSLSNLSTYWQKDSFKDSFFELGFGPYEEVDSPVFSVGEKLIAYQGKIDRLDTLERGKDTYLKIIDYKLSGKNIEYQKIYDGLSFQLFFYLDALLKSTKKFKAQDLKPSGLLYFTLNEKEKSVDMKDYKGELAENTFKFKGEIVGDSNLLADEIIKHMPISINKDGSVSKNSSLLATKEALACTNHVAQKSLEYVKAIKKGDFKALPYFYEDSDNGCTFCNYNFICQNKTEFRFLTKKNRKEVLKKLGDDYCGMD